MNAPEIPDPPYSKGDTEVLIVLTAARQGSINRRERFWQLAQLERLKYDRTFVNSSLNRKGFET